jgi:uncharacterized membrane protein
MILLQMVDIFLVNFSLSYYRLVNYHHRHKAEADIIYLI